MKLSASVRIVGVSIVASVMGLASCGYGFFPEASFPLATGCRIPKWFQLPPGSTNTGMSVRMDAYLGEFVFTLSDRNGKKVATVTAGRRGRYPTELTDQAGHRVSYEIAYVGSAVEALAIEYRAGSVPSFCTVDDPSILKSLGL